MSLFGRQVADRHALSRVRGWARELWAAGVEDAVVSVSELACAEPGCPPHETVVLIAGIPGRPTAHHKIPKPLAQIARADLERLAHHEQEHTP